MRRYNRGEKGGVAHDVYPLRRTTPDRHRGRHDPAAVARAKCRRRLSVSRPGRNVDRAGRVRSRVRERGHLQLRHQTTHHRPRRLQIGDFVDFQTLNVFPDEFESKTWTPVLHALAGLDLGLGRFLLLNGEARYTWARGPMGRDYVGFKRIDLSGLAVTAGLSLRL